MASSVEIYSMASIPSDVVNPTWGMLGDSHKQLLFENFGIIAERLSIKLIIVQARWTLVWPQSEVVLVCLSVTSL